MDRGRAGFSLLEVTATLGLFLFGLLSLAGLQLQVLRMGPAGHPFRQAVEIAKDQLAMAQLLPWEELTPTPGLVAPGWIDVPGQAPGELPVILDPGQGGTGSEQLYTVRWRVANADLAATARAIEVHVQWTEPGRPPRSYALSAQRSS